MTEKQDAPGVPRKRLRRWSWPSSPISTATSTPVRPLTHPGAQQPRSTAADAEAPTEEQKKHAVCWTALLPKLDTPTSLIEAGKVQHQSVQYDVVGSRKIVKDMQTQDTAHSTAETPTACIETTAAAGTLPKAPEPTDADKAVLEMEPQSSAQEAEPSQKKAKVKDASTSPRISQES